MNILIGVENLQMDGVKRVATVVGNKLSQKYNLYYYSLATTESFFILDAPLIKAKHPVNTGKSFREGKPLQKNSQQIEDLVNIIKKMEIDVVVLNAGLFTSFAPLIKKEVPKIKLVAWMHNNYQTYLKKYYKDMRAEFIAGLKAVDTVVTLTENDRIGFSRYNKSTIKIHNPITLQNKLKSKLDHKNIVAVSRLDLKHKGLDYLVELAQYLPQGWCIKLAGDGPDKEWLKTEIKNKKLHTKLHLLGKLTDKDLRTLYRKGAIFVTTSRWEGLPLVIGEAMSFGLPVAGMWNTGIQEYLQDGKYGLLIKNHDASDLAKVINPLLRKMAWRRYFSHLSIQRSQAFLLNRVIKQWYLLLDGLGKTEVEMV
ncbi:glycosyltransferase [Liquorilactobacillus capillatus]|uniref:Glycosyltransferase n=1 Tax=Liquorilactobacillus capillatus DSM 19910 TaxID=1423731 RepID=A0A0R1M5W8_9LACO|nr:glycosyltransferase [Liquorilactobacillus capillatus]KRL00533.1 glycosyltransferase [Liquorilactobacillus capillatus DSM 19910]